MLKFALLLDEQGSGQSEPYPLHFIRISGFKSIDYLIFIAFFVSNKSCENGMFH